MECIVRPFSVASSAPWLKARWLRSTIARAPVGKPQKVRYYLEQRDPDFAEKMTEVLCVYRQVKILKKAAAASKKTPKEVAIISYDEKPGIQAAMDYFNQLPVVQPGPSSSIRLLDMIRISETLI